MCGGGGFHEQMDISLVLRCQANFFLCPSLSLSVPLSPCLSICLCLCVIYSCKKYLWDQNTGGKHSCDVGKRHLVQVTFAL